MNYYAGGGKYTSLVSLGSALHCSQGALRETYDKWMNILNILLQRIAQID